MMLRYALIVGGAVVTIVESSSAPDAMLGGTWALCTTAESPGDAFDGTTFSKPAAASGARHVTQLAFLSRFTDAEYIAFDLASIGSTVQAASLRRYKSKIDSANYIDLERADTRAGVIALESAGLLAAGRALAILDAPIQASERP